MLTKQQILNYLFSDLDAYREFIEGICLRGFSLNDQIYWSAWFKGAEGVFLENATKGIIYLPCESI